MKYALVISIILFRFNAFCQDENKHSSIIGVSPFKIENTTITIHNKLEPKFTFGISYEKIFSAWSWTNSIDYASNSIKDYCNKSYCPDEYYGVGKLKELNIYSGFNYLINSKSDSKIKLLAGSSIYCSLMRYSGDFKGGFSGIGTFIEKESLFFGVLFSASSRYYLTKKLSLELVLSGRLGLGWIGNEYGWGGFGMEYSQGLDAVLCVPKVNLTFEF